MLGVTGLSETTWGVLRLNFVDLLDETVFVLLSPDSWLYDNVCSQEQRLWKF